MNQATTILTRADEAKAEHLDDRDVTLLGDKIDQPRLPPRYAERFDRYPRNRTGMNQPFIVQPGQGPP